MFRIGNHDWRIWGIKASGTFHNYPNKRSMGSLILRAAIPPLFKGQRALRGKDVGFIWGTLNDRLTKVTLIDCITASTGSFSGTERYFEGELFPSFYSLWWSPYKNDERTILEIGFVIDDASILFYDFDAFGSLIGCYPFIEQIVRAQADRAKREIPVGLIPDYLLYGQAGDILSGHNIGRVSATHNPVPSFGGPDGAFIRNTIFTESDLGKPAHFMKA